MVFALVLCRKPELYSEIERTLEGFGWYAHISWHPEEAIAWLAQLSDKAAPLCFVVGEDASYFSEVIEKGLKPRNVREVVIADPAGLHA